ncbi:phasin family protein [Bradyrhizobium sp.]|uniref:phasin family protein n=1 Tax=Bradyrhizobium sp. TaxID=376 RepID=UPI002D1FAD8A|nr:phasin family protein [Bradyrhizobium sp.]
MSESQVKAESNGMNVSATPLFGFPKVAFSANLFGELAEQGVARAQEGCEKIKAVSEEMAEALRESYSSNAKSAGDYGLKVIEISSANTVAAIDFFAHLLGSKSMTDVYTLAAEQARKTFDAASAQNKELWDLTQKLAAETSEPIRKRVTKSLQQAN